VSGDQLPLFGGGTLAEIPERRVEPLVSAEDVELASRLPAFVRFGTSSWSFPGWRGIVWKGEPTEAELARAGLEAYAAHPLLRAVSLDRGYYRPLRAEDLASYSAQLERASDKNTTSMRGAPPFRVLSKVWDEITTAVYPRHPRYGARAGLENPHFLDAARFGTEVLAPYLESFSRHAGPFVFELTPIPRGALDERALVARVDDFLSRLPSAGKGGPRWAFELRNAELFGPRWLDMLRANRVAHVFSFWTAMPPLRQQLRAKAIVAPFTVLRLMLPPFSRYAARKADLAPFDKIAAPELDMREDVVDILRAAAEAGCEEAFVLVNNKAEGSAPLTVRALAEKTADAFKPSS
jgi:uncharacterized protein YecE (DUF72 family)